MPARSRVVILGGGVAGLSAAHELVERGFEVEVFERKPIPGGKARSIDARESSGLVPFAPRGRPPTGPKPGLVRAAGGGLLRPPLPAEHGFRFFPGFYKHVVDTMARIPYKGGSVADNLVNTSELKIASFDQPPFALPAESPRQTGDLRIWLFAAVAALSGRIGVPADDAFFFAGKLWRFLTSCEERRLVEYERVNWWDYIEAGSRSAAYRKYFGNGITRSLVAAKARRASTKTIGDIFLQIAFNILLPGVAADRVLNGPTNDVWIKPWLDYLRGKGVRYHLDAEVRALLCRDGHIRSAVVAAGQATSEITGDYFVAALPIERMTELLSPDLLALDPSLDNLNALAEYVEWMNGVQFYLSVDLPIAQGHVIFIDSPWALTAVSQPQFWRDVDVSQLGDGTVRGILSVDISDWDVKGFNGKEARHCSREEIAWEAWAQLKRSINVGDEILRDGDLLYWFLDPDIEDRDADADPMTPRVDSNAEPLLVNYVDTWRLRPEAITRIPNLFLASDYVRTFTDLATMEAANEAARRATNGILRASRSAAGLCDVWNLHEPETFAPFRAEDRLRFRRGLGWGGELASIPTSLISMGGLLGPLLVPEPRALSDDTREMEQVAAEARSSSDEGLRRLRIVRRS